MRWYQTEQPVCCRTRTARYDYVARSTTAASTPTTVDTTETPITDAPFWPLEAAPVCEGDDEAPEHDAVDPPVVFPVWVGEAAPVPVEELPVGAARSVDSAAESNFTQSEDAGILGSYGMLVIVPSDLGGKV